jgi:spore coat polysaccharide biosynthesis protein SpsF
MRMRRDSRAARSAEVSRIGALIPIRLDSTRLPNKALLDVAGAPALERLVAQVLACGHVGRENVIICTTARPQDNPLSEAVLRCGVQLFRGSTDDLIDRLYHAAHAAALDVVLEVDGDDICAEPTYMAACIDAVCSGAAEVALCGDGLPLGMGSKAFRADCLARIFACYVPGRNDTGFGYYLTRSKLFRVLALPPRCAEHVMPELRLTLDYPEDLELFRAVFTALSQAGTGALTADEVCALVRRCPELRNINAGLDAGYMQRTRELIERYPLRLRVANRIVELTADGEPT